MNIQIKRIYEEPSASDGQRIFVDRLWARGLTKEKAKLDAWEKTIAPSTELRKWYAHDPAKFDEFKERYCEELDANPEAAAFAKKIANTQETVTLLYGAKDGEHSNAAVLRGWVVEKIGERTGTHAEPLNM